jgi:hypothetical protein
MVFPDVKLSDLRQQKCRYLLDIGLSFGLVNAFPSQNLRLDAGDFTSHEKKSI